MRKHLRKLYELLFVLIFAGLATMLIALSENGVVQGAVLILVIILTETGRTYALMKYFGDMIYKE